MIIPYDTGIVMCRIVCKTAYILINISILLIIVEHIFILLIYDMEDINPDILKTDAGILRKRA
jgi:hypothetical protein